jgi:hypothetical protein
MEVNIYIYIYILDFGPTKVKCTQYGLYGQATFMLSDNIAKQLAEGEKQFQEKL